jgi:hypothetical protein
MTSPLAFRAASRALALALLTATPGALAQEATSADALIGTPMSRVRPLDAMARKVIEQGMAASPTIVRMVAELQRTDLIVSVQVCPLPRPLRGDARVVAATPNVRHVRIRLGVPVAGPDLIVVLGHELRHALEFASMPEIRGSSSLARALARVGVPTRNHGYWETDAALDAGRVVAQELEAWRGGR